MLKRNFRSRTYAKFTARGKWSFSTSPSGGRHCGNGPSRLCRALFAAPNGFAGDSRPRAVAAGTTALSRLSMLVEDSVETYAMRDRAVVTALEKGKLFGCGGREEADARMESWKYDPWVLAEDGSADPCSLYLSLRRSGDERVQKEIRFLIERLPA